MSHHINIVKIKAISNILSALKQDFVFVGGAVVSLYVDRLAEEVRPTDDVDVLVEIYSTVDYNKMEEELRSLGFQNDVTAKFVGRYLYQGLIVDFMPLKEDVLGFTNRWYSEAFKNAQTMHIDKNTTIKIFTAPYFIASKLEAFKNRGKNMAGEYDGRVSSDFEDIIFVLANRQSIWAEMDQTDKPLNEYLRQEFINLLGNPYFEEWIDVHSDYNTPIAQAVILPQARLFVQNR